MELTRSVNAQTFSGALTDPAGPLDLDFSRASFVEPIGFAGSAALVDAAVREGRQVSFRSPSDQNVQNYMSRMGFGDMLESFGVNSSLPKVNRNDLSGELLELSKFSGEAGGEDLAELVYSKLEQTTTDNSVRETLHSAICELAANVYAHAEVESGFVAAQSTHKGTRIMFAIADSGQGLKRSLERNRNLAINDDLNALMLAVQPNISATAEKGRGQGLSDVVASATNLGGTVTITSGTHQTIHTKMNVSNKPLQGYYQGTMIQVELDCVPGN